jgi:glycosyltransferase involved in cell wall biosynthesis
MPNKQYRILHVLGTMDPGGLETWLLHVLKHIDHDRFQLYFCTCGPHPGLFASEVERRGGLMLPCPKGKNLWSFSRRFRKILREGNYDVVHSHVHLFSGALLRWAKAEGVPIGIAHSHTSQDDKPNTLARRYYRKIMKTWISRYATCGLAASMPAAADLFGENWEADERFRILHYGIDLRPFESPIGQDTVRDELGIPSTALVVGHVGRFIAAKNHRFLVEIAKEIHRRRPETHFLFVGDGPLKPNIETLARELDLSGKMHFVGTRTDVPRLMRGGMDVFVFPSIWEGLPVTLIEAQAAGLPCIVSETITNEADVLSEQIRVPLSTRSQVWAEKIIDALEHGRIQTESAVQAIARTDFCAQRSTSFLSDLYASAVR